MVEHNILVIAQREEYTCRVFDGYGVDFSYALKPRDSFLCDLICRIWAYAKIPFFDLWYDFLDRDISQYDFILVYQTMHAPNIVSTILQKNPRCRVAYWLWNTIGEINGARVLSAKWEFQQLLELREQEKRLQIWSFDYGDCQKYNLRYNNQVAFKIDISSEMQTNIEYDLFFCGINKGRYPFLRELKKICAEDGIECKFLLFPSARESKEQFENIEIIDHLITYEEILRYLMHSKAIVDIVKEGQEGITWRPLESMFYKKKLVTNFSKIKEYDFYNSHNIFIVGEHNDLTLKEFLSTPYKEIDSSIIEGYLFPTWIKRMM